MDYNEFLKSKQVKNISCGFSVDKQSLNKNAFEFQKDCVVWALKKGKSCFFWDCGLGKSISQIIWAQKVVEYTQKPVIIFAPLAVVNQTVREAEKFGEFAISVRNQEEISKNAIYVTNYDIAEHFDMSVMGGVVLDESSILKDFTSKTKQLMIDMCKNVPFKLCCTATPSPNDFTEIGNHAEFLGIMSRTEMLSTFFVHDGGNTSSWRLKGHAQNAFFQWVASWACCMKSPADLGYDDSDYIIPKLELIEHIVKVDKLNDENGQMLLLAKSVQTLNERRTARRNSIKKRVEVAAEISNKSNEQCLIWCDLNDESDLLAKMIEDSVEVRGSDTPEHKVESMQNFIDGKVKCFISKTSISGWGVNLQNCHKIIFVGLSDSFEAYYQAIRRCWRFGQKNQVEVHIIISDAEGAVKENIERKQIDAKKLTEELIKHTKDILKNDIKQTTRITETYFATEKMIVPNWLVEVKQYEC